MLKYTGAKSNKEEWVNFRMTLTMMAHLSARSVQKMKETDINRIQVTGT